MRSQPTVLQIVAPYHGLVNGETSSLKGSRKDSVGMDANKSFQIGHERSRFDRNMQKE